MRRPLCMVSLVFVSVVFLYIWFCPPPLADGNSYDGEIIQITGNVYRKEHRAAFSGGDNFIIYLNRITLSGETIPKSEKQKSIQGVVCYMEEDCDIPMGSTVAVEGKAQDFKRATNPGEFDSREYYRILKLDFRMKNVRVLGQSEKYDVFRELLYGIKEYCGEILDRFFGRTDAGIMKAVILGDKDDLDGEVKELYKRNGIMHIMAISGLHISMLGMGAYWLLKKAKVPGAAASVLCITFMWCYGTMTGMSASACRAIVMFAMKMTADIIGRTYDMLTALALSAVLLLLEQPLYVKHSGFLLSFGAIVGIGIVLPFLEGWVLEVKGNTKGRKKVRQGFLRRAAGKVQSALLSGVAIFLATFPVQAYFYFQYPVYSVILNLWIVPLMSLVMFSGLGILFLGAVGNFVPSAVIGGLCKGAAFVGHRVLEVYVFSCEGAEKIPGAVWITGRPGGWQIALYYGILLSCILFSHWRKEKREGKERGLPYLDALFVAAGIFFLAFRGESGMEITFLDVGQGDCIYIRDEEGNRYLMDGGSTSKSEVGKYQITPFLKSRGISRLQAVFVSHGDKDHYSGIEELLENTDADGIKIECLVLPATEKKDGEDREAVGGDAAKAGKGKEGEKEEEGCERLKGLATARGIRVVYLQEGDKMRSGRTEMLCLNPPAQDGKNGNISSDRNEQSQVLYLTYGDFSLLLTGDVTGANEKQMAKRLREVKGERPLTVLKVAHHGSMYSTDTEFLEMASPLFSVISCGEKNRYGHPHEELTKRLAGSGTEIYMTTESGAVTFETDGKRVRVRKMR